MTQPGDPGPAARSELDPVPGAEIVPVQAEAAGDGQARPGRRTFSLEGRRAPGLYLVGWLASLVGASTVLVVLLGQPTDLAGAILLGLGTFLLAVGLCAAAGSQAIERQWAAALGYRGPSPLLLFGATISLTLFLEVLALAPLGALGVGPDSTLETLVGLVILNGSAVVLVALLVVGPGALTWREMGVPVRIAGAGWGVPGLLRNLLEGMVLGVPLLFGTFVLASVLVNLLGTSPPGPLPSAQTPADAVINLVSGAIIAPLGEELFYRGFATTAWVRGVGVRGGILRAALLFAAAHVLTLSGTPTAALIAFATRLPVALALGWIFVRRGSLASSFGMHAVFNAIPLILVGLSLG
ncbi:MAG TPA: CPBP family intramembrane glutamic endopeptidase [Candidatus Limnocylindrales bacterium]